MFSDYFICWQPRDVVGGDIYWAEAWGDGLVLAVGDCTGHGVPGAFMSLITTDAMRHAVGEVLPGHTGSFLSTIHDIVQTTLRQNGEKGESDDGMELGVCYFEPLGKEMIFSGARFDLYIVENGQVEIIKPTKRGIGYRGIPSDQSYEEHRVALDKTKSFYLSSDGLIDQVGGPKGRGFGKRRFKELLTELDSLPMSERGDSILHALREYQGIQKRRDDVSVIGFKVD